MILKGFKEKSIKKQLRLLLRASEGTRKPQPVKQVGVLVNTGEVSNMDMFKALISSLHLAANNLHVICYSTEKDEAVARESGCFYCKDIGWNGAVKHPDLQRFLDRDFDLLISYYTADLLHLKWLTTRSKAHFKVGIFQKDYRLNDLIINTPIQDFKAFNSELTKYLNVFNTTKHDT
ncbi:DUF6913 domain-containing protein [Bizionia sediminis]|uniref:DUF6913 domain-containing protein n=1 Tax=Bizionia sediminis TaxID=1737064 RepID=A0ABW5KTF3_9FLAO